MDKSTIYQLLDVLRMAITGRGERLPEYSGKECERILSLAYKQAMFGITFNEMQKKPMDLQRKHLVKLMSMTLSVQQQNALFNDVMKELSQLLTSNGVRFMVVKGQIVGQNYATPNLRQVGDIDFYCDEVNFPLAKSVLKEAWQIEFSEIREGHHHIEFQYRDVVIEQHRKLIRFHNKRKERYWEELCRQYYTTVDFGGTPIPTLHPTLHAVYLFLHLYHHLIELGVGLRQFCDWAMMMHAQCDVIDYEALRTHLRVLGMERAYRACGTVLTDYLGVTEQELGYSLTGADRKFTRRILDIVEYRGNMGQYEGLRRSHKSSVPHVVRAIGIKVAHFVKFAPLAPDYSIRALLARIFR